MESSASEGLKTPIQKQEFHSRLLPQIRKLESTLMDLDNKTLWNDYRIAQPLNDRVVESSFLPRLGKGSG